MKNKKFDGKKNTELTILSRIVGNCSSFYFIHHVKKYIVYFLVCQILCMPVFSVLAAPATSSNATTKHEAASPADAEIIDDLDDPGIYMDPIDLTDWLDPDNGIAFPLSDDGSSFVPSLPFTNIYGLDDTVMADGIQVLLFYNSTSDAVKTINLGGVIRTTWGNGNHVLKLKSRTEKPDDFVSVERILFQIGSASLPPSGKYEVAASFVYNTEVGSNTPEKLGLYSRKYIGNAQFQNNYMDLEWRQFDGNSMPCASIKPLLIDFGNVSYWEFRLHPADLKTIWPYDHIRFSIVLKKYTGSAAADFTTAGGATTDMDIQQNISDSSSEIASNTASMADTLKEIVQTISNQLASLWDQMFNLMHVPQLANDDKNTQRIIDNQDDNTNQVTESIEAHGNFIIEGLKSLFIPSDMFFKDYFDDLYSWFSGKFGFLTIPLDIFIRIMGMFTSSDRVDFVLTLPPLSIMEETLWTEQSFNFTEFLEEHFAFLITAIQIGTSILLILNFVDLCRRKYDEVMRN